MKIKLIYKVDLVVEVDTEERDVSKVTLHGSSLAFVDVEDKHLLDDAVMRHISEAKQIADTEIWPSWDHEG